MDIYHNNWEAIGLDGFLEYARIANANDVYEDGDLEKITLEFQLTQEPKVDFGDIEKFVLRDNKNDQYYICEVGSWRRSLATINSPQELEFSIEAKQNFDDLSKERIQDLVVEHGAPVDIFEDRLRPRQIKYLRERA